MSSAWIAIGCGLLTGGLVWRAAKTPLLAWVALAPLGFATWVGSPGETAVAGALAGMLAHTRSAWSKTLRPILPLNLSMGGMSWAAGFAAATWMMGTLNPGFLVVVLPATAVLITLPTRWAGAPRWVSNPLACTQERWLGVVHIARAGGDLVTTATLALVSAAGALLMLALASPPRDAGTFPAWTFAVAALLTAAAVVMAGIRAARAAVRRVSAYPTLRVAAVIADGPPPDDGEVSGLAPMQSPHYRDVEGTLARYAPHVKRAAEGGARIVVLPEACVVVDTSGRQRWIEGIRAWAIRHRLTIVAPFVDIDEPVNALAVVGPTGALAYHEKQHPGPRIEPPRRRRLQPGPHALADADLPAALSTVICVDLDYPDLIAPVRTAGGILVVPSNDWFDGFEELHQQTAVWSAVLTGVTVLRATGHGISSLIDGAGRTIARASSQSGPVVLIADAPVTVGTRRSG